MVVTDSSFLLPSGTFYPSRVFYQAFVSGPLLLIRDTHQNHLGSFKNTLWLGPNPGHCDVGRAEGQQALILSIRSLAVGLKELQYF